MSAADPSAPSISPYPAPVITLSVTTGNADVVSTHVKNIVTALTHTLIPASVGVGVSVGTIHPALIMARWLGGPALRGLGCGTA